MEKIVNMRTLGGLVNQQGMQVKYNKLFRSGNPSVASDSDCAVLKQQAIDEIIDFRSDVEKKPSEQSFAQQFNWIAQPIFTGNLEGLLSHDLTREMASQAMCNIYQRFPIDFQPQFHYLLKQAESGKTLLFHCTAGKDRTGFAALLLLSALGVGFDIILQDYLFSNEAISGLKNQLVGFADNRISEEAFQAILEVTPEYLDNALVVINKNYGNVERYLQHTLATDIKAIRQHYLEN